MRATGIVRKLDELGRYVIPKEIRDTNGWDIGTPLEVYTDGDKVILQKYQPACIFCGNTDGVHEYKGKKVCLSCKKELSRT
jgi:transcriptional pleiotropic regulator of transition state genes